MKEKTMVIIIGAGTMGYGLALVLAQGGSEVVLTDTNTAALARARELIHSTLSALESSNELNRSPEDILAQIKTASDYRAFARDADLIIEAIIEDVEAKRELFEEIVLHIGDRTIVASNTSYLDIFRIIPEKIQKRILITHFFNPPYIIPLVEVVGGSQTEPEMISVVVSLLKRAGMTPVLLRKFVPGYIVNRLQRALGREVLYMIDEGFADPEEIDLAVKASLGIRLPILGVVARYDHTGLDMTLRALKAPDIGLAKEDRVSPSVLELVEKGHLGIKSGKGFFDYGSKSLAELIRERDKKLLRVRQLLKEMREIG